MNQLIVGTVLNGGIIFFALKKQLLTLSGALTAFVVGMMFYFLGGFSSWSYLILFFISSGVIEIIKKKFNLVVEVSVSKEESEGRNITQVLANSLPALSCLILYSLTGQWLFYVAMVATIAGATADTWSSQIGILSSKLPISVKTFKPIEVGLSGGVSLLGIVASLGGASFMAGLYLLFNIGKDVGLVQTFLIILVIVLSGVVGSIVDSILGATIQEKYILNDQSVSEMESAEARLYSGIKGIDNNMINFLSGVLTAGFSLLLLLFL